MAWDVLCGVANLCGKFYLTWQKMAWDVCPGMFCPAPNFGTNHISLISK